MSKRPFERSSTRSDFDPKLVNRALVRFACCGSIDLAEARLLAEMEFVEPDCVRVRLQREDSLTFVFAEWTELGLLAATWVERRAAEEEQNGTPYPYPVEVWENAAIDPIGLVAAYEFIISELSKPMDVRRAHVQLASEWYDGDLSRFPVREVSLDRGLTIAELSATSSADDQVVISNRRVRQHDARGNL